MEEHPHTTRYNTHPPLPFGMKLVLRSLWRGWNKLCPVCGQGKMFRTFFNMNQTCPTCGVRYERESGEYVTSMYISIVITEILFVIFYLILNYVFEASTWLMVGILVPFNGLFVVWFYPRSKSLWAAVLHLMGGLYQDQ